jgi:osmotically-inducible protein OsmY
VNQQASPIQTLREGFLNMKNRPVIAAMFATVIACALPLGSQAIAQSATAPVNDEAIVAAVRTALVAKPELKSLDLKITSKNGEVTIAGIVDTGSQLYNVADTAQKVAGVKWVNNGMSVK